MAKILNVFYDANGLPYKDKELTVHFPIVGNSFQGASKTTEIRFYIDELDGNDEYTWVANAKLPNGKIGTKILQRVSDIELGLDYVVLPLTNFYTQAKGDLYISLQGYDGSDVEMTFDSDTGLYTLTGNPTIEATGSVKLTIAYATQISVGDQDTDIIQDILGALEDKLDKNSHKYIKVVDLVNITNEVFDNTEYNLNDIIYNKRDKAFYSLVNVNSELRARTISYIDFDGIRINNQDESTMIYQDQNGDLVFEDDEYGNTVTFNMYNNDIYINDTKVVKEDIVTWSPYTGAKTLTETEYAKVSKPYGIIDLVQGGNHEYYIHGGEDYGYIYLTRYQTLGAPFATFDYYSVNNSRIRVSKANRLAERMNVDAQFYGKSVIDSKLALKADKSEITNVYKYKGSVATYEDLPSTDLTIGDVYNVEDTGDNYAWTGTAWDKLAGTVDLTNYYNKDEVDGLLSAKQDTLIGSGTGQNIKTINNESILGSGNIDIQSGGGVWGQITGTLSDQTDLNNELTEIRNIANGRCKTYNLSYQDTIANVKTRISGTPAGRVYLWNSWNNLSNNLSDLSEHDITTEVNNGDYDNVVIQNPIFNSSSDYIELKQGVTSEEDAYIIIQWGYKDLILLKSVYVNNFRAFNNGDNIYILESNVPDRWSNGYERAYKFEVDTSHLVTTDTAQDITGQKTIKNIMTFKSLNDTYNVTFEMNDNGSLYLYTSNISNPLFIIGGGRVTSGHFRPLSDNAYDLGTSSLRWKDLYLSGTAYIPTIEDASSISFKINGIERFKINGADAITGRLYPTINNTFDLGSSTLKYRKGYFSSDLSTDGILYVNYISGIRPYQTEMLDIGSSSYKWKDIYLSGNISDGTNSVSVAELSGACGSYSTNSTTQLEYSYINIISISADTTFTLATAPSNTYPEYKANITNSGASDITITLPSGTIIKGNVSISSNTFVIPAGSEVELNIQNGKALVVEW